MHRIGFVTIAAALGWRSATVVVQRRREFATRTASQLVRLAFVVSAFALAPFAVTVWPLLLAEVVAWVVFERWDNHGLRDRYLDTDEARALGLEPDLESAEEVRLKARLRPDVAEDLVEGRLRHWDQAVASTYRN